MDRRTIWAILLMMAIAVAPAIFMKKPAPSPGAAGQRGSGAADRAELKGAALSTPARSSRRSPPRCPSAHLFRHSCDRPVEPPSQAIGMITFCLEFTPLLQRDEPELSGYEKRVRHLRQRPK